MWPILNGFSMIDEFALFQLLFSSQEIGVRRQEIGDRRLFYLFSPHPTPYTLHPTPYTLHPTPYTPHPTPYTLFQVRPFVESGTL
ncbi:MAG: hypothetical protein RLZZ143_2563 [Cyanobacteriota bacterium]|jgi:hypothetical protein